jgi:hypothetical protein
MTLTQGDYILSKKMISKLNNQLELPAVLESGIYTQLKQHALDKNEVLSDCPSTFLMCTNTNMRPNRVLTSKKMFNIPKGFIKQRSDRQCFNCCYNSQFNLYFTNNANTLFSACSNLRLNTIKCNDDSLSSGGVCTDIEE